MKTKLLLALCLGQSILTAAFQPMLNYHGRIHVGGAEFNGAGQFKFALLDGAGSQSLWSNDNSSVAGAEPNSAVQLPVNRGAFSVRLGDEAITGMSSLPLSVFRQSHLRLRVWFDDGMHGFQQLTPDHPILPVAQSYNAHFLAGLDASAFALSDHAHDDLVALNRFNSSIASLEQTITDGGATLQSQISEVTTQMSRKIDAATADFEARDAELQNNIVATLTMSEIRALQTSARPLVYLTDPRREGLFRRDRADNGTPDNGGTVLVTADGARYKRDYPGDKMNVRWFGATGNGQNDDAPAITAAFNAALAAHSPSANARSFAFRS
jgi:hypothetical protein